MTKTYTVKYHKYCKMKHIVVKRDKYTCQECGDKPLKQYNEFGCKRLPGLKYTSGVRQPSFCPRIAEGTVKTKELPPQIIRGHKEIKIIPIKTCKELNCEHFTIELKIKPDKEWLVAHHIDSNPCNNRLDNFVTLCKTCHNKKKYEKINGENKMFENKEKIELEQLKQQVKTLTEQVSNLSKEKNIIKKIEPSDIIDNEIAENIRSNHPSYNYPLKYTTLKEMVNLLLDDPRETWWCEDLNYNLGCICRRNSKGKNHTQYEGYRCYLKEKKFLIEDGNCHYKINKQVIFDEFNGIKEK